MISCFWNWMVKHTKNCFTCTILATVVKLGTTYSMEKYCVHRGGCSIQNMPLLHMESGICGEIFRSQKFFLKTSHNASSSCSASLKLLSTLYAHTGTHRFLRLPTSLLPWLWYNLIFAGILYSCISSTCFPTCFYFLLLSHLN